MKTIRCVNLAGLGQSKHNLPSIVDTLRFLARITFQIDRLELLVLGELGFEITQIGDLVIVRLRTKISVLAHPLEKIRRRWAHPELLEVMQV